MIRGKIKKKVLELPNFYFLHSENKDRIGLNLFYYKSRMYWKE